MLKWGRLLPQFSEAQLPRVSHPAPAGSGQTGIRELPCTTTSGQWCLGFSLGSNKRHFYKPLSSWLALSKFSSSSVAFGSGQILLLGDLFCFFLMLYKSTIAKYTKKRTCCEDNEKQIHVCQIRKRKDKTLQLHKQQSPGCAAPRENTLCPGAGIPPGPAPLFISGFNKDNSLHPV